MSRKGSHPARLVLPDPKHGSQLIARFINMVMKSGKKSVAESIVYGALQHIGEKNAEPVALVEKALNNIAPAVEVKSQLSFSSSFVALRKSSSLGSGSGAATPKLVNAGPTPRSSSTWPPGSWMK